MIDNMPILCQRLMWPPF